MQWHVSDSTYLTEASTHGAVEIKNPISLARVILDTSCQELSLRRVPPNLLVGQGATDFAFTQGFTIVPHEALISPSARERWNRWKHDLKKAAKYYKMAEAKGVSMVGNSWYVCFLSLTNSLMRSVILCLEMG